MPQHDDLFSSDEQEPVVLQIDGILDLHCFRPSDVQHLLPDYLAECRKRGILQVRIIHGKGRGVLRKTVHARLKQLDYVKGFRIAGLDGGSWGATLVDLRAAARPPSSR